MIAQKIIRYFISSAETYCLICNLHSPCKITHQCTTNLSKQVIDFDKIKDNYAKSLKIPSPSSVDALTYNRDELFFIEIKGWKEFLNRNQCITPDNIDNQLYKYNFVKKLSDSFDICNYYVQKNPTIGTLHDFTTCSKVYVIDTDIDQKNHPLDALSLNLKILSETTSDWETLCYQKMEQTVSKIPNIKTICINCRNFDNIFSQLNLATDA